MKKRDPKTILNNKSFSSDGEEIGAKDLSGLTLTDLETLFTCELGESDRLLAESDCLSRRSTVSLYRAGRVLSAIKEKLKVERRWTKWQKDHKVGVTSAWQAIALFEATGSEAAVAELSRTEALIKFDINKPKSDPVTKGVTTKKCDKKVDLNKGLKLHTFDQEDEQPTNDHASVDQEEQSEELESPVTQSVTPVEAPAAQPMAPEATIPSVTAMEYLHKINLKLEELERGLVGVKPDDHFLSLIDQAIATLQRLRGDIATDINAA